MSANVYRYMFGLDVEMSDVEGVLLHAVTAIEHLHGEAAARLDARYFFDEPHRRCVIDGSSQVGLELNKLFAGAIGRDISPDAFSVERLRESSQNLAESVLT